VSQVQRNVGWVGKRPFDVYLAPLKSVLRIRREINSPIKSERILSLTNDRGVIPYEEKGAIGNNVSEDISRYSIVHIGDIVMNSMNVIIGSVGLSKYYGALSPVYYVLQPVNKDQMDMRYFAYHFGMPAFYKQLARIGYGILEHRMRIPWINLQNELMFVPPIAKQKAIADYLDRETAHIDVLIEKKQQLIRTLEHRRVSLVDQVFENIQSPNNRFKYVASLNPESLSENESPGFEFSYLDIGAVGRGVLVEEPIKVRFSDSPSRARRIVKNGDIIVSTVRTYLRACWAVNSELDDLIVSTGFAVLRSDPSVDSRYLGWYCMTSTFIDQVVAKSVGVSYPAINASEIMGFDLPFPDLQIQVQVADVLDRKIGVLRDLCEAIENQILLLQERRQNLITALVTGELEIPEIAA
jgi:type I restriction enzyme S subunit